MAPAVLDAPISNAQKSPIAEEIRPSEAASNTAAQAACPRPPTDAILSIEQAAVLLGETLRGVRDLTRLGLLKHQLIDGERCVWLSDLIAYKTEFERARAEWQADPLNRMWDDPFFHETFGMAEIPQTR